MACDPYTDPTSGVTLLQLCSLENIFAEVVKVVAVFASMIFLLVILFGGFKYLTSGGDPKGMETAKNTITFAFLGLLLIVGSYIILNLLSAFTGVDLTKFKVTLFP